MMSGHGVEIKFSKTQLRNQGGFLSAILNLGKFVLPFLTKKVGQITQLQATKIGG